MKDKLNNLDFDIYFDFRKDSDGKDPDEGSPTLRRYHRILWSKELPNGEVMQLTHDKGGYLKWKDFEFASDAMLNGLFFARAKNSVPELRRILRDYDAFIEEFEHQTWTIGGEIIFPVHDNSMNQLRGTNAFIMDRWDLTLECIRKFYLGEDSPLYEVLDRDRLFYELFVDFKGYVDFFYLQDCVTPDYSKVNFWLDEYSLTQTIPLPRTAGEHIVWIEKSMEFKNKRAERMKRALELRNNRACFVEEDLEYHSVESQDDYYEILDEVVNMLKRDDSLDVSTKRLRATRYADGYARYMRLNNYGCGLLFDKANWKDPDSVMTPFWLNINDHGWKLTERIISWLDSKDDQMISSKWQKQPCLALIPPINATYHQVCESLKQQIIYAIKDFEELDSVVLSEKSDNEDCIYHLKLLSGSEPFTLNGESIGLTVADFWSFQFSNILHDPDEIAEFLVAKALGQSKPYNKNSWTLFDILYRGKRIEVKQTAYYHPFNEPGKLSSVRRFGIQKVKGTDSDFRRENDVYVFCLLNGDNEESAWPLEVSHWEFYVVPTSTINDTFENQKTVSLSRIKDLVSAVPYEDLRDVIDVVINSIQ